MVIFFIFTYFLPIIKSKRAPFVLYIFILFEKTFSLNELSNPNFLKPSVDISFLSIKVLYWKD